MMVVILFVVAYISPRWYVVNSAGQSSPVSLVSMTSIFERALACGSGIACVPVHEHVHALTSIRVYRDLVVPVAPLGAAPDGGVGFRFS